MVLLPVEEQGAHVMQTLLSMNADDSDPRNIPKPFPLDCCAGEMTGAPLVHLPLLCLAVFSLTLSNNNWDHFKLHPKAEKLGVFGALRRPESLLVGKYNTPQIVFLLSYQNEFCGASSNDGKMEPLYSTTGE